MEKATQMSASASDKGGLAQSKLSVSNSVSSVANKPDIPSRGPHHWLSQIEIWRQRQRLNNKPLSYLITSIGWVVLALAAGLVGDFAVHMGWGGFVTLLAQTLGVLIFAAFFFLDYRHSKAGNLKLFWRPWVLVLALSGILFWQNRPARTDTNNVAAPVAASKIAPVVVDSPLIPQGIFQSAGQNSGVMVAAQNSPNLTVEAGPKTRHLTNAQEAQLIQILRPFAGQPVQIMFGSNLPEVDRFGRQLSEVLSKAGLNPLIDNPAELVTAPPITNVQIKVRDIRYTPPIADALSEAFGFMHIHSSIIAVPGWDSTLSATVVLEVGPVDD